MAASEQTSKGPVLSKAEYLKRYLGDSDGKQSKDKRKKKKRINPVGMGMKIVDDDVDWKQLVKTDEKENDDDDDDDDDEEEAPVVAEIIDERPEEVKCLEEFRNSSKWRVVKATNEDYEEHQELLASHSTSSTETGSQGNARKVTQESRRESPDVMVTKRIRRDSPEASARKKSKGTPDIPPEREIHRDSPDFSPVRKRRHDSPDLSPTRKARHDSPDLSPTRKARHDSPDLSPTRKRRHGSSSPSCPQNKHSSSQKSYRKGSSPSRRKPESSSSLRQRRGSDSDLSPPRLAVRRSSPTVKERRRRTRNDSESDLLPPRRSNKAGQNSDSDLSPPRKAPHQPPDTKEGPRMLSGGAAGLVSVDVLRREQEETRRREKKNQPLEDESRNVETVFRDKSGKRRDLELEREEQRRKEGVQAEKDLKYMQWGKGLVQGQMQQQNVEDALKEAQKPLARHIDDEDLDRMLREQEREGDPMADMLRKRKRKDLERKGVKERPRYQGPAPPPNRFNIMPGYRWDGVDRSNGFEKKRYSRLADQKAAQEMAYKWSVEDM